MQRKIAFFVDGGYLVNRVRFYHRHYFAHVALEPQHIVSLLQRYIKLHRDNLDRDDLYRVYYYDAPPFDKQLREPIAVNGNKTPATRNFKNEDSFVFQSQLHDLLKTQRKIALRMGKLSKHSAWVLNDDVLPRLLKKEITVDDLTPGDFRVDIKQKGVDTKIGIDITSLTLNKFVDTMVLFASDADFVPAAKLARTHGVDVVLDPLFGNVDKDLSLHIDGKKSYDVVSHLGGILKAKPNPKPKWWKEQE